MKKTKAIHNKKSGAKASKSKKVVKISQKKSVTTSKKAKVKSTKDWQDDLELEEDKRQEKEDVFAEEEEPKIENLDDDFLTTGDEDEDEDTYQGEDSIF